MGKGEEKGATQTGLEELEIKINKVYDSMLMKFKNYNVETEAMLDEF